MFVHVFEIFLPSTVPVPYSVNDHEHLYANIMGNNECFYLITIYIFFFIAGDAWAGWSGDWAPTQSGMGWGWGWPVDSYSQNASASQDVVAHQYSGKDVSQAGYTMYGNEFSATQGMAVQVCIGCSSSYPALRFRCSYLSCCLIDDEKEHRCVVQKHFVDGSCRMKKMKGF